MKILIKGMSLVVLFLLAIQPISVMAQKGNVKLKALIIDGDNNHGIWPKTTVMMKDYLEQTGMFQVEVERMAYTYQGPHYNKNIGLEDIKQLLTLYPVDVNRATTPVDKHTPDPNFDPDFSQYDLVISNLGWETPNWSDQVKRNFEKYMANGGGLVIIHAANNSFGDWPEYNKMIGLGAWGGRDTESGPYVYYDENNKLQYDKSEGQCGSHGPEYEYLLTTRAPNHPIMNGLPSAWLHTQDEMYDRMRGPAKNITVLATALSDVERNAPPWDKEVVGTGRNEPMLFTVEYGKGRVFHSALGHMDYSMECVGFMTTFLRGSEWAATGKVTQKIPNDFPTAEKSSSRKWSNGND